MERLTPTLNPHTRMNPAYAIRDTASIYSPALLFYKDLIQRNIELFSSWGAASAVSMVLLAMVMGVFLLMSRFLSLDRVFGAR